MSSAVSTCSPARAPPPELTQHRLAPDELVVEHATRHLEEVRHEAVTERVAHAGADLGGGHDVLGPQNGELLRDGRLIEIEDVLQVLNAPVAGGEELENPDADGMGQGLEELGLEGLQGSDPSHSKTIYMHITFRKGKAGARHGILPRPALWAMFGPSDERQFLMTPEARR